MDDALRMRARCEVNLHDDQSHPPLDKWQIAAMIVADRLVAACAFHYGVDRSRVRLTVDGEEVPS